MIRSSFRDGDTRLKNLNRYSFLGEVGTDDCTYLFFKSFKKWNSMKYHYVLKRLKSEVGTDGCTCERRNLYLKVI